MPRDDITVRIAPRGEAMTTPERLSVHKRSLEHIAKQLGDATVVLGQLMAEAERHPAARLECGHSGCGHPVTAHSEYGCHACDDQHWFVRGDAQPTAPDLWAARAEIDALIERDRIAGGGGSTLHGLRLARNAIDGHLRLTALDTEAGA